MLCYAWDILDNVQAQRVSASDHSTAVEILASELCRNSSLLVKKRIALEFVTVEEKTQRPRGKINFSRTIRDPSRTRRNLVCHAPTITADTALNQILKASLRLVGRNSAVSKTIRQEALALERKLSSVKDVRLTQIMFQSIKNANIPRAYRHPLALCELLYFGISPDDTTGTLWFEEFLRDEIRMRRVFETFLRNFYASKLNHAKVGSRRNVLTELDVFDGKFSLIPRLNTDITIDCNSGSKIVVDAKFTGRPINNYYGKDMLRSDHIYQIRTYVGDAQLAEPSREVHGIVIYPEVTKKIDVTFRYASACYRFTTVDFSLSWIQIERSLLDLISQMERMPKPTAKASIGGTALPTILA